MIQKPVLKEILKWLKDMVDICLFFFILFIKIMGYLVSKALVGALATHKKQCDFFQGGEVYIWILMLHQEIANSFNPCDQFPNFQKKFAISN